MGWKSTIEITREEAFSLIAKKSNIIQYTDTELEDMLEELGYGDNPELEYYGYNFLIKEK